MKKIHCEYNENEAGMHTMAILDYLIPTSREYINKTWEKKLFGPTITFVYESF